MKTSLALVVVLLLGSVFCIADEQKKDDQKQTPPVPPVLNFTMKSLAGEDVNLAKYQGKVILMVNTASKCGFTPQYKDLQDIYTKYKDQGFVILGFPANNFKNQEPGTDKDISTFCTEHYGVTFDMFSKISVLGDDKAPLYKYLTGSDTDPKFPGEVKWNFEKFLIGKDGQIEGRWLSKIKPTDDSVTKAIEAELAK